MLTPPLAPTLRGSRGMRARMSAMPLLINTKTLGQMSAMPANTMCARVAGRRLVPMGTDCNNRVCGFGNKSGSPVCDLKIVIASALVMIINY